MEWRDCLRYGCEEMDDDRIEDRSRFRDLLRSLLFSPYDALYTAKLLFYLYSPGRTNRCGMERPPLSRQLRPEEEADLTIVAGGDIIQTQGNVSPVLHPDLQDVIGRADLFIANCEAPVLPDEEAADGMITFGMPLSYMEDILDQLPLRNEQVVLSVASNHSRDQVEQDFRHGVELLDGLGVVPVGLYGDTGPFTTVTLPSNGMDVTFAGWTHLMNGERALPPRHVVNRQEDIVDRDWRQVKETEGSDMLVGIPHWDRSYQHFPREETRRFAQELVGDGFDLLLGSHPHVMQPLEIIDGSLCFYSRGNLCSKQYLAQETLLRPIIEIGLTREGDLVSYEVHFFAQRREGDSVSIVPLDGLPDRVEQQYRDIIGTVFSKPDPSRTPS